jgi:hypothetical protein
MAEKQIRGSDAGVANMMGSRHLHGSISEQVSEQNDCRYEIDFHAPKNSSFKALSNMEVERSGLWRSYGFAASKAGIRH